MRTKAAWNIIPEAGDGGIKLLKWELSCPATGSHKVFFGCWFFVCAELVLGEYGTSVSPTVVTKKAYCFRYVMTMCVLMKS